jgi:4-amino-4-deoxy-L-arabinose transferase-like glycosyltransferase
VNFQALARLARHPVTLLFLILALALLLRLSFFVGLAWQDDHAYALSAYRLTTGDVRTGLVYAGYRITMVGPVALAYALFGFGAVTTFWWPMACSLAGVVLIFLLGRLVAGDVVGLLAALLLAVYPLDAIYATTLLPDVVVSTFMALTVLLFLLGERASERWARWWYALTGFSFLLALDAKPVAIYLLAFFASYIIWQRRFKLAYLFAFLPLALLAAVLLGAMLLGLFGAGVMTEGVWKALFVYFTGGGSSLEDSIKMLWDWLLQFMDNPLYYPLNFLTLIGITTLLLRRSQAARIPLLWLGSTFLYVQFGPSSLGYFRLFYRGVDRYFTIFTIPLLLVLACYLAEGLDDRTTRFVVPLTAAVTALVVGIACCFVSPQVTLWEVTVNRNVWIVSSVAGAAAVFGGLISPLLLNSSRRWLCSGGFAAMALLLGLSSLQQIEYSAAVGRYKGFADWERAVYNLLQDLPPKVLYSRHNEINIGLALSYGLEKSYRDGDFRLLPWEDKDAVKSISDAYVTASVSPEWPANWHLLQRWKLRSEDVGFYYAPSQKTVAELEEDLAAGPTPERYLQLIIAYSRDDRWPEALEAYRRLRELEPDIAQGKENLLSKGGFEEGCWNTNKLSEATVFRLDSTVSHSGQNSALIEGRGQGRHGLWFQTVTVERDAVYLFSAWVKTQDVDGLLVELLQWEDDNLDIKRGSDERMEGLSADWTYVETLLVLPPWASPVIHLAPVVVYNEGLVWVDDVRLVKLSL